MEGEARGKAEPARLFGGEEPRDRRLDRERQVRLERRDPLMAREERVVRRERVKREAEVRAHLPVAPIRVRQLEPERRQVDDDQLPAHQAEPVDGHAGGVVRAGTQRALDAPDAPERGDEDEKRVDAQQRVPAVQDRERAVGVRHVPQPHDRGREARSKPGAERHHGRRRDEKHGRHPRGRRHEEEDGAIEAAERGRAGGLDCDHPDAPKYSWRSGQSWIKFASAAAARPIRTSA